MTGLMAAALPLSVVAGIWLAVRVAVVRDQFSPATVAYLMEVDR